MDKLRVTEKISKFTNIATITCLIYLVFFQYKNGNTGISEEQYLATLLILLNVAIGRIADNAHKNVIIQSLLKNLVDKQDNSQNKKNPPSK